MRRENLITPIRQYINRQTGSVRWGFDDYFTTGERIQIRRHSKSDAQKAHIDLQVLIANGRKDLAGIDAVELAAFRTWRDSRRVTISISTAIAEFMASKSQCSNRHTYGLERDLNLLIEEFGNIQVGELNRQHLQALINNHASGSRRRFNIRAAIVSFFRWMRSREYLPDGITEADRLDKIDRGQGDVHVLTPAQMQTLLDNVRFEFLPWLVIGGFAGIRSEEIAPDPKSKKSPLMWEDFKWTRKLIDLRRETAKTGKKRRPQRRLIPIQDNLFEWLRPWHNATGRVCAVRPTQYETARLGKFIGGKWPHNCLRDSYGSYWAAIHKNLPELAYQMGNSVQMIEQSYHERQEEHDALAYFSIMPTESSHKKVTAFSIQRGTKSA